MQQHLASVIAEHPGESPDQLAELLLAEMRRVLEHRLVTTPYGERGLRAMTYRRGARDAVQ